MGLVRSEPEMTTNWVSRNWGGGGGRAGQTMYEMTTAQNHNAQVGHSTPETIHEITPDTQVPLRGASKWWAKGTERKTEECGRDEEKQIWRLEGSEE